MVINTEWGALGNTGSLDFVRTRWDHAVDAGSKNFGKQVFWFSCYSFINVHFLFCCKLCPKLFVNRLKGCLFKGLWKADQWDVPWRTFQTGGFQQKFRNLKSTFNLFQVLLEAVDKRLLFPGVDVMRTLGERDCLQTRHISAIESDGPGEYSATWEVLRELGLEKLATASDCRVIRWGKNNFQLCRFDKQLFLNDRNCS